MVSSTILVSLFASLAVARRPGRRQGSGTITCPITLDGRVPVDTELADFDSYATSPFNPDYIRGDESFSETLLFPDVLNSRFDDEGFKSVEVTISDLSIFQEQNGFRRIGLQIQVMLFRGLGIRLWLVKTDQLCLGRRERGRSRNGRSENSSLECQARSRAHFQPHSRVFGKNLSHNVMIFSEILNIFPERMA